MLELQDTPPVEGKKPMTEDEICVEVLGKRRNYTRGLGNGFISTSRSLAYNSNNVEFEEYKRNAEETKRQLTEQLENLNTRQAKTEALLAQLANVPALQSILSSGESSR
ncbi:hypothetical protein FRX31_017506 [Thalictrum thalictroides]|uniref:Uncharacterized protein n=1 Tax=Thalictrum thalictroides TaxID=46969 RepID=A0A7J6W6B4_THATH|nr:hypothetical protein FRX31_017506 [Thalictrum thalictroides]